MANPQLLILKAHPPSADGTFDSDDYKEHKGSKVKAKGSKLKGLKKDSKDTVGSPGEDGEDEEVEEEELGEDGKVKKVKKKVKKKKIKSALPDTKHAHHDDAHHEEIHVSEIIHDDLSPSFDSFALSFHELFWVDNGSEAWHKGVNEFVIQLLDKTEEAGAAARTSKTKANLNQPYQSVIGEGVVHIKDLLGIVEAEKEGYLPKLRSKKLSDTNKEGH